jgi:hypothetical protein
LLMQLRSIGILRLPRSQQCLLCCTCRTLQRTAHLRCGYLDPFSTHCRGSSLHRLAEAGVSPVEGADCRLATDPAAQDTPSETCIRHNACHQPLQMQSLERAAASPSRHTLPSRDVIIEHSLGRRQRLGCRNVQLPLAVAADRVQEGGRRARKLELCCQFDAEACQALLARERWPEAPVAVH